jgi:hypothetical protein
MVSRNFFSKCIDIERTLGAIYLNWSELASYGAERQEMWAKLSQDEAGHALDLEFACRLAVKNEIEAVTVDISVLDKLQGQLNDLFATITKQPLADAEAVQAAVELEAQTMVVHTQLALVFADPELMRVFSALGTYDKKHLAGLAQAYAEKFKKEPTQLLHGSLADSSD